MNTKSVLLVEDDATCAKLYQALLERHGYAVTVSTDGSDAFIEAHNRPYDLLVLDLMLPNMDGLAILRRLRAQKRFKHTPIFLYTSSELGQVEPLALEAGATRVFAKDRSPKDIVQEMLDTVAAVQAARGKSPTDSSELDVRQQRDYRVSRESDAPKLTLKMVEPPPEPPKPPPPPPLPPRPPVVEFKDEDEASKKGLLSRLFKPKPKDD